MPYSNFITKALCLAILLAALNQYQARAQVKAREEAENAAAIAEVEAYNRDIRRQMAADTENDSPYADGGYEGVADGFGGPIRVRVTIDGGDIVDVQVVEAASEDPAYYAQAESVLGEILSSQGVNVDTVSGATFSSTGIINATTAALRESAAAR